MATNLPTSQFPTAVFGEIYHERWRIEEAFKRRKHRCKLVIISGLTQHVLMVDVRWHICSHTANCAKTSRHTDSRQRTQLT
jgi:hypothetical protein